MQTPETGEAEERRSSGEVLRSAFRELHGPRLHGFAILLTLGDRSEAARLAAEALNEGTVLATELRHPERAAAWLRARVVRGARGWTPGIRRTSPDHGLALRQLGVDAPALRGLSALSHVERAALIASDVERLDPLDVATVLNASTSRARRIATAARRRYLRVATPPAAPDTPGELATRVREAAHRAMS